MPKLARGAVEESGSTGWDVFDPHLVYSPNGALACFHGSYKKGGIRVLLSSDGGKTSNGPGKGYGYSVDPSTYGYAHPMGRLPCDREARMDSCDVVPRLVE